VTRPLRGLPSLSGTRVVAVTGYCGAAVSERANQTGFDEHLLKPIHPGALGAVIVGSQGTPHFMAR